MAPDSIYIGGTMEHLTCPECGWRRYERIVIDELTTEWRCEECGFYCRSSMEFGYWKSAARDRGKQRRCASIDIVALLI